MIAPCRFLLPLSGTAAAPARSRCHNTAQHYLGYFCAPAHLAADQACALQLSKYKLGGLGSDSATAEPMASDKPLMRPDDFSALVVPVLVEKWLKRCFCRSSGFLKLLSFDFADYREPTERALGGERLIAPVELLDSELIWSAIVGKHFVPRGEWTRVAGREERVFQCPQCEAELRVRSEQYGINMWPTTTRPSDDRHLSRVGVYLVGFHFFTGKFDPAWITDFSVAQGVDHFIECMTASG